MEGEVPVTFNFYNDIQEGTLPDEYDVFLQSISDKYNLSAENIKSFFFELETKDHKYYRITPENYSQLNKKENATIYLYFTESELHGIYNIEEEEEEEDEKNYKPNIKIEYVNKEDEPDPFEKEKKIRKKEKNKKNGKKSRTKQYQLDKKNGELSDESFTKEDLDQITQDKKNIEKTIELLVNKNDEEDDEKVINEDIEKNYIYEPQNQKRKNINQIEGKINYLPKEVKEVRKEKIKKNKNEKKINEDNNNNDINDKKNNNEDIKDDFNGKDDEKKKNKLRKQALKAERREKRKEKKELKQAFKNEKKIQQHQIAEANKTVRYGLSIKDL